ncbi:MAG: histidine kinase [Novosphingobium sp.]|nr:histidine kinase [Novosphingobium sp.]
MIFDDRLETVLRTSAAGKSAARTQLRQLVDLLGVVPVADWNARHAAALQRVEALESQLSDEECAAVLRAAPHRSSVLVYHFAHAGPRTAAAAIAAARLTEEDWLALIPRLPTQARGFVRHRSDLGEPVRSLLSRLGVNDFLLPQPPRMVDSAGEAARAVLERKTPHDLGPALAPAAPVPPPLPVEATLAPAPVMAAPAATGPANPSLAPAAVSTPNDSAADHGTDEGIGAIVRRIEAFRRKREARDSTLHKQASDSSMLQGAMLQGSDGIAPRLPFADVIDPERPAPLWIDLRCDAEGVVVHAAIDTPGMLAGARAFCIDPEAPVHCNAAMAQAFRHRQPISAGQLRIEGAPAVSGTWQADGTPLFAPDGGRFTGYLLRLRRPLATAVAEPAPAPALTVASPSAEADRLRQLLHELRTPINAIQGFAEMIQSQALGSTPHQYRAMAASIASDAAQILAGFEEVERLAKLESHALALEPGEADAAAVIARLIDQFSTVLASRNVRLTVDLTHDLLPVTMAAEELERAGWRVLSVIAASVAPGERLSITLQPDRAGAQLVLALPAALYRLDDATLFAPDASSTAGSPAVSAMLGNGFALRLARAEFSAAGGSLRREGERLCVILPTASHSNGAADPGTTDRATPLAAGA